MLRKERKHAPAAERKGRGMQGRAVLLSVSWGLSSFTAVGGSVAMENAVTYTHTEIYMPCIPVCVCCQVNL